MTFVIRTRHLDVVRLLRLLFCSGPTIILTFALEFFLVKVNIVLFNVYDGLPKQGVSFAYESRNDLSAEVAISGHAGNHTEQSLLRPQNICSYHGPLKIVVRNGEIFRISQFELPWMM